MTYYSYCGMMNYWLTSCDVRNEHGKPAALTPHQWRHPFACRLINRDVPQEVIRILLDHQSTQMTAPEFLPELREHRGRILTLITDAEVIENTRVAEMNKHVLTNLDKMIDGIDQDQSGETDAG